MLSGEIGPRWKEVSFVIEFQSLSGRGEWLTWAASSPHRFVVRPPGLTKRMAPDTNSGEEMALSEPLEITGCDLGYGPAIDMSRRDSPRRQSGCATTAR